MPQARIMCGTAGFAIPEAAPSDRRCAMIPNCAVSMCQVKQQHAPEQTAVLTSGPALPVVSGGLGSAAGACMISHSLVVSPAVVYSSCGSTFLECKSRNVINVTSIYALLPPPFAQSWPWMDCNSATPMHLTTVAMASLYYTLPPSPSPLSPCVLLPPSCRQSLP